MKRSIKRRKSKKSRNDHGWFESATSKVSNTTKSVANKVSNTAGSVANKVYNTTGSVVSKVANSPFDSFTLSSLFSDGKYRRKSSKSRKKRSRKRSRSRKIKRRY